MVVAEVGAPLSITHGPQLDSPVAMVSWYADLVDKFEWTEELGVAEQFGRLSHRWIEKEPVGVVAAIVPYNYPIQITLAKLVPALAAGCTVVVKGPPDAPWLTASLGRLIAEETDIPPGVVNVLTSQSVEVGEVLTTDPLVDMVSFTGSTPVGRRIMAAASDTVKKVFLELGGKSAFIVLDDADLSIAAMFAGFTVCSHAGQGCAITTRLLVPETKRAEVIDLVSDILAGVHVGDPGDASVMMGPLINERQRDKVEGMVDAARGERRVGSRRRTAAGEPAARVLLRADSRHRRLARRPDRARRGFGPVLTVLGYKDEDDAVAIANNSIFGLSGAVFGDDIDRATAVGRRIRSGTVSINGGIYYGPDAPFGGYKQSGVGREMGVAGLQEYLELKTLATPAS